MKNYWVEKIKKNDSGNWVLRVKNKHTGRQIQRSFDSNRYSKREVQQIKKQIEARDLIRNQDDYEYDPFNYIYDEYNFQLEYAIKLFMEDCAQKELAATTIRFREAVLTKFKERCSSHRLMKSITEQDIKDFVQSSCRTINSQNQYGSVFRLLIKFLREEYDFNPNFEVPIFGTRRQRKKESVKKPTILSEEELWELYVYGLKRFPREGKKKNHLDLQCLPVYFYTGMRKEELPYVKLRDIDLGGDIPTVVGRNKPTKSNEERTIWVPQPCNAQLRLLMNGKSGDDYLLSHDRSGSQDNIMRSTGYVFGVCYEKAFPKRDPMSLHNLRHSCGCWLLEQGFSMMFVKDQLGHASLNKTLVYARMTAKGFENEVNRFKQRKGKKER